MLINSFLRFSSIGIFLLFKVSMIVNMKQYISCPLSFRNPPAILSRFFAFRKSRSDNYPHIRIIIFILIFLLSSYFIRSSLGALDKSRANENEYIRKRKQVYKLLEICMNTDLLIFRHRKSTLFMV